MAKIRACAFLDKRTPDFAAARDICEPAGPDESRSALS